MRQIAPILPVAAERNRKVLAAALALAQEHGFSTLTRDGVAARAGVSMGTVNNAFGTMDGLRQAVLQEAVATGVLSVVASGLAIGAEVCTEAPDDLKRRALATLV